MNTQWFGTQFLFIAGAIDTAMRLQSPLMNIMPSKRFAGKKCTAYTVANNNTHTYTPMPRAHDTMKNNGKQLRTTYKTQWTGWKRSDRIEFHIWQQANELNY